MRRQAGFLMLALSACAAPEPPAAAPPRPVLAAPPPGAPAPPRPARRPAEPPAAAQPAPATFRVAQEGTTGCADPAVLRLLRAEAEPDAAALRRLAVARAAGGCVTVFPAQPWRLIERGEDVLRLAPVTASGAEGAAAPNGLPGPLYFWRDQVIEQRGT